jgi:hypothetical protein
MIDVSTLEGKIKRLKKTLSEQRQKDSSPEKSEGVKSFRKQLKRLQRKRRILISWMQRTVKLKEKNDEKEQRPSGTSTEKSPESA